MNFKSLKDLKLKLFFFEAVCFLAAAGLSVIGAGKILALQKIAVETPQGTFIPVEGGVERVFLPDPITILQFVIAFILTTILVIALVKYSRGELLLILLFALAAWAGCQLIFNSFFSIFWAIFLAIAVVMLRYLIPRVFIQNLIVVLAIAGISMHFGLSLSFEKAVVILAFLACYDIISVYQTGHMVKMFKGLVKSGAIFSLVIPEKVSGFKVKLREVKPNEGFLYLGGGDLAFPAILMVSALSYNVISSVAIAIGAVLGLFVAHFLFVTQKKRRPMPALPPIALGSILGFLVSMFF